MLFITDHVVTTQGQIESHTMKWNTCEMFPNRSIELYQNEIKCFWTSTEINDLYIV